MSAALTTSELCSLLDTGALVLAPSARAAQALRRIFDERQRVCGLTAWEPASVLSWEQWTQSLWNSLVLEGCETRLLLNEAQEHHVWSEILKDDPAASALTSIDSLADLAHSAFRLAALHNAMSQLRATATTRDARLFARWAETFVKRCATQKWLAAPLLESALLEHISHGGLPAPAELHLAGFGEWLPAQQALLDAFREHSTTIHVYELRSDVVEESLRASTEFATEREEAAFAARWLRSFFDARRDEGRTAAVAVIVPDLSEQLADLEVAFREVLSPELEDIAADLSSTPWEFSSGAALASKPMVAAALDLSRFALGSLGLSRISSLLLTPWFGHAQDRELAAVFDARVLRRAPMLRPELSLRDLLSLAARNSSRAALPAWLASVEQLVRGASLERLQTYAEWTEFIRSLLAAAGFPGERPLSAAEFALTRAWDGLLDMTATLDFSGRRIPFETALGALERQARATAFIPPRTNAPIQIMTPDEAVGCCFDAVIFIRATDANLPASERLHPLLGWPLQREHAMPGSSASATVARALARMRQIAASTNTLLFTYAKENADGEQRCSPLLEHLELTAISPAELIVPPEASAPVALEAVPDDASLPPLPSVTFGGARVLKLQAACGFLAFAELRLRGAELESRSAGFDARESGSLLHLVVQRFWSEVRTRDALIAMPEGERAAVLSRAIEEAFARTQSDGPWDLAYVTLQKERLRSLLLHWLSLETQRGPFTVLSSERESEIAVGPLTLNVRVDRIDQVEGGFVFVDYKTGFAANVNDWLGARPNDPQLPLYALLLEPGELQGLVFGKVRAGKDAKWIGYQAVDGIFPAQRSRTVVDLNAQTEEWRSALVALAEDFYQGRATVSPKEFARNCRRCAQRLLCRLDREALLSTLDDEDEGEKDG